VITKPAPGSRALLGVEPEHCQRKFYGRLAIDLTSGETQISLWLKRTGGAGALRSFPLVEFGDPASGFTALRPTWQFGRVQGKGRVGWRDAWRESGHW
jgi:hypothetical protein